MTDYIIGAGQTASIVKMFFPKAHIVADGKGRAPPLCELWETFYTREFVKEFGLKFKRKTLIHNYIYAGDLKKAIKKYNKLTHKPTNSSPSMGKNFIKVLDVSLPSFGIDLVGKARKFGKQSLYLENRFPYFVDNIFWCAPLLEQKIYPIKVIELKTKKEVFKSDYIYLFDKKYLDNGLYRISKHKYLDYFVYKLEFAPSKKSDIPLVMEYLRVDGFVDIKDWCYWNLRNGHIEKGKRTKDKKGIYFFGRFAQNDNEILLSDVIEKCYKIRERLK